MMRLMIVSNRLPITVAKKDGKLIIKESSGGLVSGLSSYLDSLKGSKFAQTADYIWIGWPGMEVSEEEKPLLELKISNEYSAYPVHITEQLMENFYQGFCNNTIWPLFHYFPSLAIYEEDYWNCYKIVNEKFLEVIMKVIQPDDIVWIHDYHLMLLPGMLREKMPDAKIGFFLHIPFPTYEIFSLMPSLWRTEILKGLLGSDVAGFHTYSDTQYFLRCILRILGIESDLGSISYGNRILKADTFPMGIDYKKYNGSLETAEVKKESEDLQKIFFHEKIILSIDRLDYTKGILNRLQAYGIFLEKNPQWKNKVVLILKVIPSRIGVKRYRKIKKQIDELVGKINGKFGSLRWTPIYYQYGFIPFHPLAALYSISDIMLVTPLRDGMNLISKEYLACRGDGSGVLILSEMAGSSKELGEALIINPNSKEEIADAIKAAILMPPGEQIRRNKSMQERLKRYDVVKWADDFIQKVISVAREKKLIEVKLLNGNILEQLLNDYHNSENNLILIDYDGTLVPFEKSPEKARPDNELIRLLKILTLNKKTDIVLISGRDKNTLQDWFGEVDLEIIAEHGVWFKEKNKKWEMIKPLSNYWKPQIYPILEMFQDRLPGSFIEEKDFSLVYHYRKSDPELASVRTRELVDHLRNLTANIDLNIIQGSKIIEIRSSGINKGTTGLRWISRKEYDFIMAVGDDITDEDLFKILPDRAYSVKVGNSKTCSRCFLPDYKSVIELLYRLVHDN